MSSNIFHRAYPDSLDTHQTVKWTKLMDHKDSMKKKIRLDKKSELSDTRILKSYINKCIIIMYE